MSEFDTAAWREQVTRDREQKDRFFGEHPHSPVPRAKRGAFEGLDYYPPDPDYRVEATVTVHDDPEELVMQTTTGEERTYAHAVTLNFAVTGVEETLAGYRRVDGDEPGLFVPFRDETSGETTYGAGRYLELDAEPPLSESQTVVVDFNGAYSPFCAYNDGYSCPLAPTENWLDLRVEAGERYDADAAYAVDHEESEAVDHEGSEAVDHEGSEAGRHGHDHDH
jgi:hypothetical protein